MKCAKIREMFSNGIDNELSESELQFVGEHLKVCFECRELYEKMKALDAAMAELDPVAVPENFSRRAIRKLSMKQSAKVVRWSEFWKLRNAAAYGAVAGVVLLSLFLGNCIGKFLYKEILSGRSHHYYKNPKIYGIAESRVNTDGISYVVYDKVNKEVHND